MSPLLSLTSGVLIATGFGGMVFFALVFAPLVFTRLPEDVAGPFIRQVFPSYYLTMAVITGLAAATSLASTLLTESAQTGAFGPVLLLALLSAGFAYARQGLMPRVNALRDRQLAGDDEAGPAFERLHRASVALNALQLALLFGLLVHELR